MHCGSVSSSESLEDTEKTSWTQAFLVWSVDVTTLLATGPSEKGINENKIQKKRKQTPKAPYQFANLVIIPRKLPREEICRTRYTCLAGRV